MTGKPEYVEGTILYGGVRYVVNDRINICSDSPIPFDLSRPVREITIRRGALPPLSGVICVDDCRKKPRADQTQYSGLQTLQCNRLVSPPIASLTKLNVNGLLTSSQMVEIAKVCVNLEILDVKYFDVPDMVPFPRLSWCGLKHITQPALPEWVLRHEHIRTLIVTAIGELCADDTAPPIGDPGAYTCTIDVTGMPSIRNLEVYTCGCTAVIRAHDSVKIACGEDVAIVGYPDADSRVQNVRGVNIGPFTRRYEVSIRLRDVIVPVDNRVSRLGIDKQIRDYDTLSRLTCLKTLDVYNDVICDNPALTAAVRTLTTLQQLICPYAHLCSLLDGDMCDALSTRLRVLVGTVIAPSAYPLICKLQRLRELDLTVSSPLDEAIYGLTGLRSLTIYNKNANAPDVFPTGGGGFSSAFPRLKHMMTDQVRISPHMCEGDRSTLIEWIILGYNSEWQIPFGLSRYMGRARMEEPRRIKSWPFALLPIVLDSRDDLTGYYASARHAVAAWTGPLFMRDYMAVCGADTYLGTPTFPRDIIGLIAFYVDGRGIVYL